MNLKELRQEIELLQSKLNKKGGIHIGMTSQHCGICLHGIKETVEAVSIAIEGYNKMCKQFDNKEYVYYKEWKKINELLK